MLCSINSNNTTDYGLVKLNVDIPWKCDYVKYHVSSINTKGNILIVTKDDYLMFSYDYEELKIVFEDKYTYSIAGLVKYLNACQKVIVFKNIDGRTISLTSTHDVSFVNGSHRAKLITGLFNVKDQFDIPHDEETFVPDLPILDYANKLYLISLQGQAVHSNIGRGEYTPSVMASIDTVIEPFAPIIIDYDSSKPIKIKTYTDSLKYIEMRLVDFMYQPVILKSPLFVNIKIKPCNGANVKGILTK